MNSRRKWLDSRTSLTICGETCSELVPRLNSVAEGMLDTTLEPEAAQTSQQVDMKEAQLDQADQAEALDHQAKSQLQLELPHQQLQEAHRRPDQAGPQTPADARLELITNVQLARQAPRESQETLDYQDKTVLTESPEKMLKTLPQKLRISEAVSTAHKDQLELQDQSESQEVVDTRELTDNLDYPEETDSQDIQVNKDQPDQSAEKDLKDTQVKRDWTAANQSADQDQRDNVELAENADHRVMSERTEELVRQDQQAQSDTVESKAQSASPETGEKKVALDAQERMQNTAHALLNLELPEAVQAVPMAETREETTVNVVPKHIRLEWTQTVHCLLSFLLFSSCKSKCWKIK